MNTHLLTIFVSIRVIYFTVCRSDYHCVRGK